MPDLFQSSYPLPELPALDMKLRRLSKRILEGAPVNNKTFRETYESWLVFYYPDKSLQIALSQGHTTTTQYEHYLNMPFEEEDRKEIRKWVEGVDLIYTDPMKTIKTFTFHRNLTLDLLNSIDKEQLSLTQIRGVGHLRSNSSICRKYRDAHRFHGNW